MTVIRGTDGSQPSPTRQAVILIDGIGEQRPMVTLRGFVDAFLEPGTFHSKPDKISSSYELRRIKLRRVKDSAGEPDVNPEWPETDLFEYYWAHQMCGTRIGHVVNWLRALMVRGAKAAWRGEISDGAYHSRLKWMVFIAWLSVPLAIGVSAWSTVCVIC